MRLGSIICATLTTFVIFESGVLLKNEKAGWIASLLYNLSIYTSIIAGLFVMPDSPQVLFFALSIYMMLSYVIQPSLFTFLDWIVLGLFIGLATLSKVHGLFLWAGFGAFILFHQSKTLSQKNIYGHFQCHDPYTGSVVDINHYGPVIGLRYFSKRIPALS